LGQLANRCARPNSSELSRRPKRRILWTLRERPIGPERGVFNDKNSVSGIDCGFVTARHEDWLWQGLSESLRPVRYFRGRRL